MLAEAVAEPDRWDRVVCLHSPGTGGHKTQVHASAFVVRSESSLYLVTAAHAAEQTQRKSRLRFRTLDGKSQWVSLGILFSDGGAPWVRHKSSDLSIARIPNAEQAPPHKEWLNEIAFHFDDLDADTPSRTTEIEEHIDWCHP